MGNTCIDAQLDQSLHNGTEIGDIKKLIVRTVLNFSVIVIQIHGNIKFHRNS